MPFKYTVRHVPSGQNIADCLSRLTKIPNSPRGGVTEEYGRMVAVTATPRAMTTREIERESAEDEELTEVRRCWKTGDYLLLLIHTGCCVMKLLWLEDW